VTWNIDLTRTTFKQSFQQAIDTYGDRLRAVVAAFVIFKQANGPQPWPHATADKASGFDPTNGRIRYKPYADNNIWHCHCDLQGADPLIAYQIRPAERRIIDWRSLTTRRCSDTLAVSSLKVY
jgi:hypothetical protein